MNRRIVASHCLPEDIEKELPNLKYIDIPKTIAHILTLHQKPIQKLRWRFERSLEAATHSSNLVKEFDYNLNEATQHQQNTVLTYGSKFRTWQALEPLLQHHYHWLNIKHIIIKGATYPLKPIPEPNQLRDIAFMLDRGNHKSAKLKDNNTAIDKAFSKEVSHHWTIPFLPTTIPLIPGSSITPLGMATQWSINEQNERVVK